MEDCIFCKIIKSEIPAAKIYEDSHVLAFLDIAPVNIGHALIIPKEHFANIYETPDNVLEQIIKTAKKIAVAIKSEMKADGVNVTMNNDPAAGQVIFHTHLHIIPRKKEDGFGMWHGRRPYNEGEKEKVAKKLISAIES